jgi:hypothetical protein
MYGVRLEQTVITGPAFYEGALDTERYINEILNSIFC